MSLDNDLTIKALSATFSLVSDVATSKFLCLCTESWKMVEKKHIFGLCVGLMAIAASAATTKTWLSKRRRVRTLQKMRKEKKTVLITGCDSGFGYSLALHCHSIGLNVIATCFHPMGNKEGSQSLLSWSSGEIDIVSLDVTSLESISSAKTMVEHILKKKEAELFCVVNNAATLTFGEAEWHSAEMARRAFDTNVIGPLLITKAFLPKLRRCGGRLVNMVSFCTDCPLPCLSVYTSTKAALRSLSSGMRMELAKFGVDVVLLNPGDHPSETPLCSHQNRFYDEMRAEVAAIDDDFLINDFFDSCQQKFTQLFPPPPLSMLNNPGLYEIFEEILTAERPQAEYINSDVVTRLFFGILNGLPIRLADRARIAIMRLPSFQAQRDA